MEVGQSDIGGTDADDAEEDEAEGIWQLIHSTDEAGRTSMAIQEINRQCQHQKGRSFNDEVMAQELDDRNADDGKANDAPEAEMKGTGHGFCIKFFHDFTLPRHIGRLNCRYIGAKHAIGNPNQRIDDLHGKGINPCFIQTQKAAAHEDRRLSCQISRNRD